MTLSASAIVEDSTLLLHRVDPVRRRLVFRRTTEQAIRGAAFIDGRTDIWTGPPVELPFSSALELAPVPERPRRTIFHMSFCGSTLLARLLDRPGKTLALKEPNCLVDLADWRGALAAAEATSEEFHSILSFATAMLGRDWAAHESILVKPSSWANNLIGELTAASGARALFVTIAREDFLTAVLRGGRERLTFTARLAAHLASSVDDGQTLIQRAIESTPDALGKAVRLALVAHHVELQLFRRALASGLPNAQVDFAEIEEDAAKAATRAAVALELGLDRADIEANCARWAAANAKADALYSIDRRRSENEQVRAHFGPLVDAALNWAEGELASEA